MATTFASHSGHLSDPKVFRFPVVIFSHHFVSHCSDDCCTLTVLNQTSTDSTKTVSQLISKRPHVRSCQPAIMIACLHVCWPACQARCQAPCRLRSRHVGWRPAQLAGCIASLTRSCLRIRLTGKPASKKTARPDGMPASKMAGWHASRQTVHMRNRQASNASGRQVCRQAC